MKLKCLDFCRATQGTFGGPAVCRGRSREATQSITKHENNEEGLGGQNKSGRVKDTEEKIRPKTEITERDQVKRLKEFSGKEVCVESKRMKSGERKVALLAITEHIEMELLSSEEPCVVILTEEEEDEHSFHQVSLLQLCIAAP